jgi:hypothetical protein
VQTWHDAKRRLANQLTGYDNLRRYGIALCHCHDGARPYWPNQARSGMSTYAFCNRLTPLPLAKNRKMAESKPSASRADNITHFIHLLVTIFDTFNL